MNLKRMVLGGLLSIATIAFLLGAVFEVGSLVSFGGSLTSNVVGQATVLSVCYISLSNTVVNFGSIASGANVPTANTITVTDNGGNAAANVLIAGGIGNYLSPGNAIWIGTSVSNTIGIANTLWNPSTSASYTGNAVTNTLVSTGITIPAPTQSQTSKSASIFLGMGIPGGTPADVYTTNIVIENSC